MKCLYCGREVTPQNNNCPKCKAAMPAEQKKTEKKKEDNTL